MKKRRIINLFMGEFIIAIGFNIFLLQYNLIPGGVSGIAIILNKLKNIDTSLFILITNIFLVIFSYFSLGKKFAKNTLLGALLNPIMIKLTSYFTKYISLGSIETIFVAILGGIIVGYGTGVVYKSGYSSGGTDVIEFTLSKYLKIPMNKAVIIIDGLITISGGIFLGFNSLIYSLITLYCISILSNKLFVGINNNKTLYILSKKYSDVKKLLLTKYKNDITILKVQGGKLNKNYKIFMSVVRNNDYEEIKKDIKKIDNNAFVTILKSYEVYNVNKMVTNSEN